MLSRALVVSGLVLLNVAHADKPPKAAKAEGAAATLTKQVLRLIGYRGADRRLQYQYWANLKDSQQRKARTKARVQAIVDAYDDAQK